MQLEQHFDSIMKSIDEVTDFNIVRYDCMDKREESFYLLEQSSLQILRELPSNYSVEVQEIYSQRHRVAQRIDQIKSCSTIQEYFAVTLPLVENGSFPCDNLTMTINNRLYLQSHDDGEVTITSLDRSLIHGLMKNILSHQGFRTGLLDAIVEKPTLFHKLERPNSIITSFETFEEVWNDL